MLAFGVYITQRNITLHDDNDDDHNNNNNNATPEEKRNDDDDDDDNKSYGLITRYKLQYREEENGEWVT